MGTWWKGIRNEGLVLEVRGTFRDLLKRGLTCQQATARVLEKYAEEAGDETHQHLVSIALVELQWKYGELDRELFRTVERFVEGDSGASILKGQILNDESERRRKLKAFIVQLQTRNPKPLKVPEFALTKPPFEPGDCLAIALPNAQFGAALVLAKDHSDPAQGRNLIGLLNYSSRTIPSLELFNQRRWLRVRDLYGKLRPDVCWYGPTRFHSEKHRFRLVGQIKLKSSDPKESSRYAGWTFLGRNVIGLQTQSESS